jgi:uncharacterized membrane protein
MASAVKFLFHPSTLAMPFVILAWDSTARHRWKSLAVWMVFLLLFKESLSLASTGIGLWLMGNRDTRIPGIIVCCTSLLSGILIVGWAIPMMRIGEWAHFNRIAPLTDISSKIYYLLILLLPFTVLHNNARAILLALPLILLNILTGYAPQYGMQHHYDDIIIPLLFAGAIGAIASSGKPIWAGWRPTCAATFGSLCIFISIGSSPLRIACENFPNENQRYVRHSLTSLQSEARNKDDIWFLQTHLDPFVQRIKKTTIERLDTKYPPEGAMVILSPHVCPWPDESFAETLFRVSNSTAFVREQGFTGLYVFRGKTEKMLKR